MQEKSVTRQIFVKGMTCSSCGLRIEKKLKSIAGVESVAAIYQKGRVNITYDDEKVDFYNLKSTI